MLCFFVINYATANSARCDRKGTSHQQNVNMDAVIWYHCSKNIHKETTYLQARWV